MGTHADTEQRTRAWLDERGAASIQASRGPDGFVYDDDGNPLRLSRYAFENLQRKLAILRWLDRLSFASFLDVGSGWDYYPYLVRTRYGAEAYYCDMLHRTNRPLDDLRYGKLDHAVTLNVNRLPFRDRSFDVVLASEVLEHLVRPIEAIAELLRVTRKCLVMTSLEALSPSRLRRWWSALRVDPRVPHVERNFFLLDELAAIFGPGFHHQCLFDAGAGPVSHLEAPERQQAAFAALRTRGQLAGALCRAVAVRAHGPGTMGILLLETRDGSVIPDPDPGRDAATADWLIGEAAAHERTAWLGLAIWAEVRKRPEIASQDIVPERPVADALLALLQCPDCRAELGRQGAGLLCRGCGASFASDYGVPILFPARGDASGTVEEALERLCGGDARRRRIVGRLAARLRAREQPPGILRRGLWRLLARA
jgi:SAM-dependent methyltransferase